MMSRIYRTSGRVSDWVSNNAGVIITFVIGQGIAGLIFLTLLAGRVSTIESRGSPEVMLLERRVAAIENHDIGQEKKLDSIDLFNTKLTALDVRLTSVEVKQANVLDTLRDNGGKLDKIFGIIEAQGLKIDHFADVLNSHVFEERNNKLNPSIRK